MSGPTIRARFRTDVELVASHTRPPPLFFLEESKSKKVLKKLLSIIAELKTNSLDRSLIVTPTLWYCYHNGISSETVFNWF